MKPPNRYLEAFKEGHNIVGLAAVAAVSAALLNPLPALVGLVAEAGYLLFVADSRWYALRLAQRYDAEVERRRELLKAQVLPMLRPEMAERFRRLENTRQQIASQVQEGQTWIREVLRKLDYLLEKFLQFASKDLQFRVYLLSVLDQERAQQQRESRPAAIALDPRYDVDLSKRNIRRGAAGGAQSGRGPGIQVQRTSIPPADDAWCQAAVTEIGQRYQAEIDRVSELVKKETDANTRAVLDKRVDVLHRRQEFVVKIGRILGNLSHQIELLEDTFGLIGDEIQARSPDQVISDIEDVVTQTNTMTQLLDEMGSYEQSLAS